MIVMSMTIMSMKRRKCMIRNKILIEYCNSQQISDIMRKTKAQILRLRQERGYYMSQKEFGVIGLGEFGRSIAISLAANGCQVMAIDIRDDRIQDIADYVTMAVRADVCDADMMSSLGLKKLSGVVIAIGDNLEASIMATIVAKEAGVPYILAKVSSEIQATVLKKVGVDEVIFPEQAMGKRIARNLVTGNFIDIVELSKEFSMIAIDVPQHWIGKSLRELNIRDQYGMNCIARKDGDRVEMNLDPDRKLLKGEHYIFVGDNDSLEQFRKQNALKQNGEYKKIL